MFKLSLFFLITFLVLTVSKQAAAQQSTDNTLSDPQELLQEALNIFGGEFPADEFIATQKPTTLLLSPRHPEPNQDTTITIQSGGRPVTSLFVSWFVNDTLFSSGVGMTQISLNTGRLGQSSTVFAEITRESGFVERTIPIIVGPSRVDILWEAIDVKRLPFYRGKSLPSWDSILKAYALPEVYSTGNNQRIPNSTLVYTWTKNQRKLDLNSQSGYGKSSVFVLGDFARREHSVRVDVLSETSRVSSTASAQIKLHDPSTLLYEKHPLQGIIFERVLPAVVTQTVSSGSIRIVAYPFGIDSRNRTDLSRTWKLNGRTLNNTSLMDVGEIPLVASDLRGSSTISVETKNKTKPLQSTSGTLRINVE